MKKLEKLIPIAIEAIVEKIQDKDKKNKGKPIPKPFTGYIASFGPSMIQSGLLPTVLFYSEKGDAKADRRKVLNAICWMIREPGKEPMTIVQLMDHIIALKRDTFRIKKEILEAVIALKLALRVFPKKQD